MTAPSLVDRVGAYYTAKLKEHGPTARGVDWNSPESQRLRFEQLALLLPERDDFSLLDFGCGYGAFLGYLRERAFRAQYRGFDVSPEMIAAARTLHADDREASFSSDASGLAAADFVVASGIFNVKLDATDETFAAYMLETVHTLSRLGTRGFAFNALSTYSDEDRRRPDLYYADPLNWFDHCRRRLARFVTLQHDYPLWEFTLLVRR